MRDMCDRWRSLTVYAAFRALRDEAVMVETRNLEAWNYVLCYLAIDVPIDPCILATFEYGEMRVNEMAYDLLYLFEYGGAP